MKIDYSKFKNCNEQQITQKLITAINEKDENIHHYIKKYSGVLDWRDIASNAFFDFAFYKKHFKSLKEHSTHFNVKTLIHFTEKELSFYITKNENPNWNAISFKKLTKQFVNKHLDKLNYNILLTNESVSFDLLIRNVELFDVLTWALITPVSFKEAFAVAKKTNFVERTIEDRVNFINYIKLTNKKDVEKISKLLNVPISFIFKYKNDDKLPITPAINVLNNVDINKMNIKEKELFVQSVVFNNKEEKELLAQKLGIDSMYIDIIINDKKVKNEKTSIEEKVDEVIAKIRANYTVSNYELDFFIEELKKELIEIFTVETAK